MYLNWNILELHQYDIEAKGGASLDLDHDSRPIHTFSATKWVGNPIQGGASS